MLANVTCPRYLYPLSLINNIPEGLPDGTIEIKDNDFGIQGFFGVLIEPRKGTRFGIVYRTEADLDFKDNVSVKGLGPGLRAALASNGMVLGTRVELDFTIPRATMVSGYHELTDRLAIMGNEGN